MPTLAKLHNEYKDRGLVVISVNVKDKHNLALQYAKDINIEWAQIYVPENGDAWDRYGLNSIPSTVLFAPDSEILNRTLRGDKIIEYIGKLLV